MLLVRNHSVASVYKEGIIFAWVRRFESGFVRKLDDYSIHLMFARTPLHHSEHHRAFLLLTHLDAESNQALSEFALFAE